MTPWNPSCRATAKVKNPLPVPTTCRHCNAEIYGREYGEWPWAFLCQNKDCRAYVGLHPLTGISLGTLATASIRSARRRAKDLFNPLWQSGETTRDEAYAWLTEQLGITNVEDCHIGWFDVPECKHVLASVMARRPPHEQESRAPQELVPRKHLSRLLTHVRPYGMFLRPATQADQGAPTHDETPDLKIPLPP